MNQKSFAQNDENAFKIRKWTFDFFNIFFGGSTIFGFLTLFSVAINPSIGLAEFLQDLRIEEKSMILYSMMYVHTVVAMIIASSAVMGMSFLWFQMIFVISSEFQILGDQFEKFSLGKPADETDLKLKIDEFKVLIKQYQKLLL